MTTFLRRKQNFSAVNVALRCNSSISTSDALKVLNIQPVAKAPHFTEVVWGDQHKSVYLNAWLRDHCRCLECLDDATQQRSFDSLLLMDHKHIRCVDSEQVPDGKIRISLDNATPINDSTVNGNFGKTFEAHVCEYTPEWLRSHCNRALDTQSKLEKTTRKVWDKDSLNIISANEHRKLGRADPIPHLRHVPSLCYADLCSEPDAMRKALAMYGISFISGVPLAYDKNAEPDPEKSKIIMENLVRKHLGYPRETIWGTFWDTGGVLSDLEVADGSVADTAYTNMGLRPHVDCTYLRDPPQLQVFLCMEPGLEGGSSTFLDGFKAAEDLHAISPEAFNFFSKVNLPFHSVHDGVKCERYGPVFDIDPRDAHLDTATHFPRLRSFRYNNDDRSPLSHLDPDTLSQFYDFLPLLLKQLRREDLITKVNLTVGDMVVVDNHRVLHGRTAFRGGKRNLIGCYAEMDEVNDIRRA